MDKLLTIFKVPELRRKILFTAVLLAIYRIGFYVPLPIVNQAQLQSWEEQPEGSTAGKLFGTVAMFGGTSIGMSTIFGLGIMPYISASIIFQLLGSVVPSLEAMMKEGESGRKRINEYTRYATVGLCAIQSAFWVQYMMSPKMNVVLPAYRDFWHGSGLRLHHDGRHDLPDVGRRADRRVRDRQRDQPPDHGGHPGAAAGGPEASSGTNSTSKLTPEPGKYGIMTILILIGLFIAVVVGVIAITESQRRIPTQSAKHVRGRRVFGGTRQYLPLKVNQAGVMPIIFASSLLIFPSFVFSSLDRATPSLADRQLDGRLGLRRDLPGARRRLPAAELHLHGLLHHPDLLLLLLLDGHHLQPQGHGREPQGLRQLHPGYRPGRRTADYLEKVMLRITYVGAAFLALVAVIPSLVQTALGVDWTDRLVPGRDRAADRHQRLPRPGAEDRQPPGHAELHGPGQPEVIADRSAAGPLQAGPPPVILVGS